MENKTYFIRPNIAKGDHPVETGEYIIATPSTYNMFETILEWIEMRQPGGLVYGPPRFGKTRAIVYVTRKLKEMFESKLPIISFLCMEHNIPNENVFFEEFLWAVGHNFPKSGKAIEKRNRLCDYLRCKSEENPHKRLIIFLDEAQNLQTQHYRWLIDLYNDLDRKRVIPTFILVGQKELATRRNAFVKANCFQIVGRFMINTHQFRGLTSAKDVQVCLHCFDENTKYPIDSEWTFSRYFFPVAFEHGWRLVSESERLWQAFLQTKRSAKLPGNEELPMQFFTSAIEYVLKKHTTITDIEPHFSLNTWKEAVLKSGYHLSGDFITAEGAIYDSR